MQENLTTKWEQLLLPAAWNGSVGHLAAHFLLPSMLGCGAGSAYEHPDVWVQLNNDHYTVTTSFISKLFCLGETSVIAVEGKNREISSFHYSPIKREWQTTSYLSFHWLGRSAGF